MPCSPLTVPPRRTARSNSSCAASPARARCASSPGSSRNVAWTLPSPAWPQEHASRSWRAPMRTVSAIASSRRSTGTAMSSDSFAPRAAVTASETPSRQRHSARAESGACSASLPGASASRSSSRTRAASAARAVGLRDDDEPGQRRRPGTPPPRRGSRPRRRTRAPPGRSRWRARAARRRSRPRRRGRRRRAPGARSGAGTKRSHAAVMIPSVPSEPVSSARRS